MDIIIKQTATGTQKQVNGYNIITLVLLILLLLRVRVVRTIICMKLRLNKGLKGKHPISVPLNCIHPQRVVRRFFTETL